MTVSSCQISLARADEGCFFLFVAVANFEVVEYVCSAE